MKLINTLAATALSLTLFVSPLSAQDSVPQCCIYIQTQACFKECDAEFDVCPDDPTDQSCVQYNTDASKECYAQCRQDTPESCASSLDISTLNTMQKYEVEEWVGQGLCTMGKKE